MPARRRETTQLPPLATPRAPLGARLSPDRYRSIFGGVAAPVAVVTTVRDGEPHGSTVSAFASLSLDPPLVLVSLDRASELLRRIRRSRHFALNVLADSQQELAVRFATKAEDKFDGVEWDLDHGLPRLAGCQAFVATVVERVVGAGDHMVVMGLAVEGHVREVPPLLYHRRRFCAPGADLPPPPARGT